MSEEKVLHRFNFARRETPVTGSDPAATRFRGPGVHPVARMAQFATDIAAEFSPRSPLPRAPLEVQLDIVDAAIEHGILPNIPKR